METVKPSSWRDVLLAWMVAIAADTIQIAALPLFAEGAMSPADDVLDIGVAIVLIYLLGWHWAFLPTLAAEFVPGFDLFPTWTAAVWFVTRDSPLPDNLIRKPRRLIGKQEILPPGPLPAHRPQED